MKKELLAVAMLLFAGGNLLAQPHVNDGTSYLDRKSTRLNSSHASKSRMPSSA